MWVTEFACINFNLNKFCSQQETNDFIWNAIRIFEVRVYYINIERLSKWKWVADLCLLLQLCTQSDDRIKAYSYADADNGENCKLSRNGKLTESGKTYLAAVQEFGNKKDGNKMKRAILSSSQNLEKTENNI